MKKLISINKLNCKLITERKIVNLKIESQHEIEVTDISAHILNFINKGQKLLNDHQNINN